MLWLSVRSLLRHRWLILVLAFTISLPLMLYLMINAGQEEISRRYEHLSDTFLVVEQSGTMGELFGSRLPEDLGDFLKENGASLIVPEIRTTVGTTPQDIILLRGITLETYRRVEPFRVIAGQELKPGDPPRMAMVGEMLAKSRKIGPGDVILIRGRAFTVQGIYSTGTYADLEAWIPLEEAQNLLGLEDQVSVFIILAGESFHAGQFLPGGIEIVQMGEGGINLVQEFRQLLDLLRLFAGMLGVSAAIYLGNALWRLVWQHRLDLVILQTIGYSRWSLLHFIGWQSIGITLAGFLLGTVEAILVLAFTHLETSGMALQPVLTFEAVIISFAYTIGILLVSTLLPVAWISHLSPSEILRTE